jgi:hypothetical protein
MHELSLVSHFSQDPHFTGLQFPSAKSHKVQGSQVLGIHNLFSQFSQRLHCSQESVDSIYFSQSLHFGTQDPCSQIVPLGQILGVQIPPTQSSQRSQGTHSSFSGEELHLVQDGHLSKHSKLSQYEHPVHLRTQSYVGVSSGPLSIDIHS